MINITGLGTWQEPKNEDERMGIFNVDIEGDNVTKEQLVALLEQRKGDERINLAGKFFKDMDLSGMALHNIDFTKATFTGVNLDNADMDGCSVHTAWFEGCTLRGTKLTNADMMEASFRNQDLSGIDISGTNMYGAVLEDAKLDGLIHDERTQWYEMKCPPEGQAFICWKCCTDLRVVQMLVPREAHRVMASMETGRTSKVKVLSIKSIDESESFDWAQSTVDQDFFYEVGKWTEPANGFEEDRWKDSSRGIHFFLERQQCVDYQTK